MSYSIEWHPQALKSLERLQTQIAERILRKLELVKEEPFRFLKHFEGKFYNITKPCVLPHTKVCGLFGF